MWRARRYLADATAVKLTRNPDGLTHALQRLDRAEPRFARGDSAGILFLHWPATSGTGANRLRFEIAAGGTSTRPGLLGRILRPILLVFVDALLAVGIVAMLAGAVLTMTVTLLFVGAALASIRCRALGQSHWSGPGPADRRASALADQFFDNLRTSSAASLCPWAAAFSNHSRARAADFSTPLPSL